MLGHTHLFQLIVEHLAVGDEQDGRGVDPPLGPAEARPQFGDDKLEAEQDGKGDGPFEQVRLAAQNRGGENGAEGDRRREVEAGQLGKAAQPYHARQNQQREVDPGARNQQLASQFQHVLCDVRHH